MTRVSIIIPCYNDGTYLSEAVDSALAQDYPDTEVVVVDDGSTDPQTLDALASAERRVSSMIRVGNVGVSSARNIGIGAATGAYILPLDADDKLHFTYARRAAAVLDAHSAVGVVGADTEFIGSRSGVITPVHSTPPQWLLANHLPVSAMFRRSDWETVHGYSQELRWGEDWHFWVKIIALDREVRLLPGVGLYYRQRRGQVTERVVWSDQELARTHIIRAGIPIIDRAPDEASCLLGSRLNQLEAIRQRPSERLRTALRRRLTAMRLSTHL